MKPIQTQRTLEKIFAIQPPEYKNEWIIYDDVKEDYLNIYFGSSTSDDYFPIAISFDNYKEIVIRILNNYYIEYFMPYGLNEVELEKQLNLNYSWMNFQIRGMLYWYEVYNYVKKNYYDNSVGIDEVGITWLNANLAMEFSNVPIIERIKIKRKIYNKNIYQTITTYYPTQLKSYSIQYDVLKENTTLKIVFSGIVFGQEKWIDAEGNLQREFITETFQEEIII